VRIGAEVSPSGLLARLLPEGGRIFRSFKLVVGRFFREPKIKIIKTIKK
jgi:hypothetical protein